MKYPLLLLFLITCLALDAQTSKKPEANIASGQIFINKKRSFYYENDSSGNLVFSMNSGANGPVSMVYAGDFDSRNRETRALFAHSNFGYFLTETVYDSNRVETYKYFSRADTVKSIPRGNLDGVRSKADFYQLEAARNLANGSKRLSNIALLDASGNMLKEYQLSENGDTTQINTYGYNAQNQEVYFHYETPAPGSEIWNWEIYTQYDSNGNKVLNYRVVTQNGISDTTEVYRFNYQSGNLLQSEDYYLNGEFRNKTDYFYDRNGRLVEEDSYDENPLEINVRTKYRYNERGDISKKTVRFYGSRRKEPTEVWVYKLVYR